MFIRRTSIKSRSAGEPYFTYRISESERIGDKIKSRTLLNLGRHFDLPKDDWKALTARIEQLIGRQKELLDISLPEHLEEHAQHYAARILATRCEEMPGAPDFEHIDLQQLALVRPRQVGVEHMAVHAMAQLGLMEKLSSLGFNRHQLAAAVGNIVGRMAQPGSELSTHRWLQKQSALGELIAYDFEAMSLDRLYTASDLLWKHREALEGHMYGAERDLFGFEETITLYDLTNTYFEGEYKGSKLAKRGHSKEKRSDAPLVTLGLVLDGSGFVRRSRIFCGNASEPETLEKMLDTLDGTSGTAVVLDAGIATQENLDWLKARDYRYLVVSRKRKRSFDPDQAVVVKETANQKVRVQRRVDPETGEVELYCHSEARQKKEQAIQALFAERFEAAITTLSEGLHKKGTTKKYGKVMERIGRLKQKYARAAQHYQIDVVQDEVSGNATQLKWQRRQKSGSQATHPGVYCLRTDLVGWDEATLWRTYTMLTDLEAVFRSMKSELGMRPIYHQKDDRISGHLFITLLAYHLVHTLRTQLKAHGIHDSWQSLRQRMQTHQRMTVCMRTRDQKTIHIRQSTTPEVHQKPVYEALGITCFPGQRQKTIV